MINNVLEVAGTVCFEKMEYGEEEGDQSPTHSLVLWRELEFLRLCCPQENLLCYPLANKGRQLGSDMEAVPYAAQVAEIEPGVVWGVKPLGIHRYVVLEMMTDDGRFVCGDHGVHVLGGKAELEDISKRHGCNDLNLQLGREVVKLDAEGARRFRCSRNIWCCRKRLRSRGRWCRNWY